MRSSSWSPRRRSQMRVTGPSRCPPDASSSTEIELYLPGPCDLLDPFHDKATADQHADRPFGADRKPVQDDAREDQGHDSAGKEPFAASALAAHLPAKADLRDTVQQEQSGDDCRR